MMLQEKIRDDDFQRNTALQHCCDIVSNGQNTGPALLRCGGLKVAVANHPVSVISPQATTKATATKTSVKN